MKSKVEIEWRTGEPAEEGNYIVTLQDGTVDTDKWVILNDHYDIGIWENYDEEVIAYCLIESIEPYQQLLQSGE